MKKIITMLATLVFTMSCFFAVPAFAAETEEITPYASEYFSSYNATITSSANGKVNINVYVNGKKIMTQIGATKVVLKEYDGSSWTSVKTFNYSSYPDLMGYNQKSLVGSVSYSGTSGKKYKAIVTFIAKDSNGSDTVTYTASM